ncbi:MAG: hypothetical protein R6X35_14660 [Candidatus Krumholzibacteriia bacterium]
MRILRTHGPIYLLLLAVVFTSYGRVMNVPLWNDTDARILCDAHELSRDPVSMFTHIGFYFSQPVLQLGFLAQYRLFGLDPSGYLAVNLAIHATNAFVVYMLVNMLFPTRRMALLAAVLFAFGVGSYGRVFGAIHQQENLLLAGLHLLVMYVFIRNDYRHEGQIRSRLYLLGLALFLVTGLTRATSFSLVGVLIAYKVLFYRFRGRRIVTPDVLILLVVALIFYWAQARWGYQAPTVFGDNHPVERFSLMSVKNIFRYLNMMFLPIQPSSMLEDAPFYVNWLFAARTLIRTALALAIISFSFFGFVFGSRAIRFFIAWTYITVLPFTDQSATGQWLNLSHLYLTSVGFCVVLAAGTTGTANLLRARPSHMWVPYLVPLIFVVMALGVTDRLHQRNRVLAESPEAIGMRMATAESCRR